MELYMTLGQLIDTMQIGQVAKAEFAISEVWYIKKTEAQQIRYCSEEGNDVYDLVPLTWSNLRATYVIVSK